MAYMNKVDDCPFCGVDAGEPHKRFCPEAPEPPVPEVHDVILWTLWYAMWGAVVVLPTLIAIWYGAR